MTPWEWALTGLAGLVVVYALAVALLAVVGRTGDARALARFLPDCVVLVRRLLSDGRVSRARRVSLLALVAYLAMPFDLVPDFIPVAGQLDDVIVILLVLRSLLRSTGPTPIREHWPGPERSLRALLRALAPTA
jgi:uncharacterized membrane protein YkvA (DUF1232 family)